MRPVGRRCRSRLAPPVAPADGRVDGERAEERGAHGDVEHAGAHDEDGAAELVRPQQVLGGNSIDLGCFQATFWATFRVIFALLK